MKWIKLYLLSVYPLIAEEASNPCLIHILTLQVPEMKKAEFANSVDLDEVAHNEPPHLDLYCLPSSL